MMSNRVAPASADCCRYSRLFYTRCPERINRNCLTFFPEEYPPPPPLLESFLVLPQLSSSLFFHLFFDGFLLVILFFPLLPTRVLFWMFRSGLLVSNFVDAGCRQLVGWLIVLFFLSLRRGLQIPPLSISWFTHSLLNTFFSLTLRTTRSNVRVSRFSS